MTFKQLLWLRTRGNRDQDDVIFDEHGYPCVYMHKAYKGDVLIKIPHDKDINLRQIDNYVYTGEYNG